MDLSLRGSQINLAVRHKPKAPIIKYPLQRPRSANINRLGSNSPLYRRPFSVDLKLGFRNFIGLPENIYEEEDWKENNQEPLSTSSSNLLKFLLNEPIKRSWVCPDCDNISLSSIGDLKNEEDTRSVFLRKETGKKTHCLKEYTSVVNNKSKNQSLNLDCSSQNTENSKMSTKNNSEVIVSGSTLSSDDHNFWRNSKSDLPGKVSFGRNNVNDDADILSDCENENGFLVPVNSLTSNKKSVHFEEHNETKKEDYDFSKCTINNCSCKPPRSSPEPESYPLHNEKPKCLCEFSCNSSDFTNISIPVKSIDQNQGLKNGFKQPEAKKDEINLIRQYGDCVNNGNVQPTNENIEKNRRTFQIEIQGKLNDIDKLNNTSCFNNELSDGDKINGRDLKTNYKLDSFKQNDFSDIKNYSNLHNATTDMDSIENTSRENTLSTSESPNPTVRSYLETVRNSSGKKQNNTSHSKRSRKVLKTFRSKSASALSEESKRQKVNVKNARTFSCLREDSNLDEFHLDKVDSWMSLHKPSPSHGNNFHTPKYVKRYSPEDYEENDITASPQHSKSESQDSSTYEEIVSVIREIEEDKRQEKSSESEEDMDLKLQTILESEPLNTATANSSTHQHKLNDILSYLDDVENSCEKTLMETRRSLPESNKSEIDFDAEDVAEDVPKLPELLLLPNHQLAKRVISLSLRANELTNAIQLSKETVARIRLEKQKALRVEKQSATNRIREQKKHYEGIVARHQGFIEQLLKDKALLCEKVAAVTKRLDSQNQAWEHKLETELARAKETALAGEKIRKERWVRDNTKKIKELTVKGLEAEINKMNSNHQQEILELKRQHQQELLDALEEARLKHEEVENSLRDSLCKDREAAIEKERIAMRERFERQMQLEQNELDEQKAKLLEEVASERERLETQLRQKENEFQAKVEELLREKENVLFRSQAEYREKLEQQEQKYQSRIDSIEKQFESDYLVWKKEFENACRLREAEKENTLRQHYRAERDHQIDVIVSKMDAESLKNQEEFENKLSRMKEKYDKDIRDVEALEKSLREKYTEARNKLAESDAEIQNLRVEIKKLQLELSHSKKAYEEILAEKEQIKSNYHEEIQNEIATITAGRDAEIQKIYTRVQQAIEKKDATLDVFKKENASLRERCLKLEVVIRQQRKDYCIK